MNNSVAPRFIDMGSIALDANSVFSVEKIGFEEIVVTFNNNKADRKITFNSAKECEYFYKNLIAKLRGGFASYEEIGTRAGESTNDVKFELNGEELMEKIKDFRKDHPIKDLTGGGIV